MKNVYIIYLRTAMIPYLDENKKVCRSYEEAQEVLDNESYFTDYMMVHYDKEGVPECTSGKIDRPLVKRLKHK